MVKYPVFRIAIVIGLRVSSSVAAFAAREERSQAIVSPTGRCVCWANIGQNLRQSAFLRGTQERVQDASGQAAMAQSN
jgi:hypothetical protein